ncbi:hypothetical protein [Halomonas elongata]|uniref:Uncharacterized protein n=1 Tax=Halomonas elongata (strain ATCC 33173 / DSM 2581 / NBRC 15536 / NCIMB 2198 / 1H9) TaxID=768066 RepID=E1VAC2_HALED|nr:hypothetical protein [Halomonas elongata]WBF19213.1 hypothetical protein LM502_05860 [Halomonas elongata]WPU48073.1 hypothetical protein SR933_04085 [Halomonas elongata DSM 2581]CBV41968.1 uncharacterized protein HELO_2084 [Halomonas elongata DSM 2581]
MAKGGWSGKPTDFALEVEDDTMVLFRELCEQASRGVIYRAPIDTSRFLANNNFSVNTPDETFDENKRDPSRSITLADARRAMAALKPGDSFHIVNTTPYGKYLEAGTSGQAPTGIYGVTFNSIKEYSGS